MTDQAPSKITNLDGYGNAPLPWSRAHDLLISSPADVNMSYFLGTVGTDGRPHSNGFGAMWFDGDILLVSSPDTRKSRNLAANPACTVSVELPGLDLVLEGEASRITDTPTLEQIAKIYRDNGWPAEVKGDTFTAPYSAPSAGKPPYYVYRIVFQTAYGVATAEPNGATRWEFER